MKAGTWFGIIVIVLLLAFAIYWTYLSTVTTLPAIGLGMTINRWVQFGGLIVLGVILWYVFRALASKKKE